MNVKICLKSAVVIACICYGTIVLLQTFPDRVTLTAGTSNPYSSSRSITACLRLVRILCLGVCDAAGVRLYMDQPIPSNVPANLVHVSCSLFLSLQCQVCGICYWKSCWSDCGVVFVALIVAASSLGAKAIFNRPLQRSPHCMICHFFRESTTHVLVRARVRSCWLNIPCD